ncbi:hypothetical protein ACO0K8_20290 [Undibacterium sp. Ren11W]
MAKQEKGVAAGLPPAGNRTATTKIQTRPSRSKQKNQSCQRAYSMRFFKHAGLKGAWTMRDGGVENSPYGAIRLRLLTYLMRLAALFDR